MYIHIYIRIYTHTYIRTNRHTNRHTCLHTYTHTYIHACMRACMRTYWRTDTYILVRTCTPTYMHRYIHTNKQAYIHASLYVYVHAYRQTHTLHTVHTLHTHISFFKDRSSIVRDVAELLQVGRGVVESVRMLNLGARRTQRFSGDAVSPSHRAAHGTYSNFRPWTSFGLAVIPLGWIRYTAGVFVRKYHWITLRLCYASLNCFRVGKLEAKRWLYLSVEGVSPSHRVVSGIWYRDGWGELAHHKHSLGGLVTSWFYLDMSLRYWGRLGLSGNILCASFSCSLISKWVVCVIRSNKRGNGTAPLQQQQEALRNQLRNLKNYGDLPSVFISRVENGKMYH